MFIYNIKCSGSKLTKFIFAIIAIILVIILAISFYNIFFNKNIRDSTVIVDDSINSADVFEITTSNYTNVLKACNDNIDSYVGLKVHFSRICLSCF